VKEHELLEIGDQDGETILHATGGGAYKYADLFEKEFKGHVKLRKHDEISSLVNGMNFVLTSAKNLFIYFIGFYPSYTYREGEGKKMI